MLFDFDENGLVGEVLARSLSSRIKCTPVQNMISFTLHRIVTKFERISLTSAPPLFEWLFLIDSDTYTIIVFETDASNAPCARSHKSGVVSSCLTFQDSPYARAFLGCVLSRAQQTFHGFSEEHQFKHGDKGGPR
jgi:hypothetical protein